jgi:hypothetical protein
LSGASDAAYPDPPWHTHGFGLMCPAFVRTAELRLPPGLEPISVAGVSSGILAYIEYRAPSPLRYSELIWMPTLVRGSRAGVAARGYYVARMYVDHPGSLAAGRELWALPKTLARFERRGDSVEVVAEDGSELVLSWRALSPGVRLRSRVATLQPDGQAIVRFRADFTGKVRPARARIERFETHEPAWAGMRGARRPLGLSSLLEDFTSTMHAPSRIGG